jgi:hypothetical protein
MGTARPETIWTVTRTCWSKIHIGRNFCRKGIWKTEINIYIYIYRCYDTREAPICEVLCQYNLHATKNCAVVTLETRGATEDGRVEAEEMIGEGQDIATGTVPAFLLYNLLHLPSRKRCPIPRKRQSLLSVLPSPREEISKRREYLRGWTFCQESGIFELFLQFKFMVWSKEHLSSFGV